VKRIAVRSESVSARIIQTLIELLASFYLSSGTRPRLAIDERSGFARKSGLFPFCEVNSKVLQDIKSWPAEQSKALTCWLPHAKRGTQVACLGSE